METETQEKPVIAGYTFYFIHTMENGMRTVKSRFVQTQYEDFVLQFIEDHKGIEIQEEVVDHFLRNLKNLNS